ncbi:hypothetical protein LCGC14_2565070 [marine sediment metagenome]|uniref:Uncharacterized protein n=1 Tax=marine sediment metagenome TaxID=412755 RepID=A0A0F9B6T5_9ZZZZ
MNKNFYKLVFCSLAIGGLVNSLAAIESSAIWMQKIAKIKNAPHDHNSIPNSCLSKKLRSYIKEISALHQEGILDGEFLVAKGSKVLLDLKSADVAEIAVDTIGAPQFMIGSTSKQFTAAALLKALYENMAHGDIKNGSGNWNKQEKFVLEGMKHLRENQKEIFEKEIDIDAKNIASGDTTLFVAAMEGRGEWLRLSPLLSPL